MADAYCGRSYTLDGRSVDEWAAVYSRERGASKSAIALIARLAGACATEQSHANHTQQRRRDTLETAGRLTRRRVFEQCASERRARELIGFH